MIMMIFVYTFIVIFAALVLILGLGGLLVKKGQDMELIPEGEATAAMCTTVLLGNETKKEQLCDEDFVIEQDLVYTYDSVNL